MSLARKEISFDFDTKKLATYYDNISMALDNFVITKKWKNGILI